MAKPNAFVKISGNLIAKEKVLKWLKELSKEYFVAICIGGGEQINAIFKKKGLDIKFGPLGRITETLEKRQISRNILEINQARIQDLLDERGINARVFIPVLNIASVLCHVNGDVEILAAYNGYNKLYILTSNDKVTEKRIWLDKIAKCFVHIEKGKLDKIEVIGF